MARKPNTSNSSGVVNRLQELERRFKQRMDLPGAQEVDILERIGGLQQRMDAVAASPNSLPQAATDIYNMQNEIERLYGTLSPLETRREQAATKGYISGTTTALRASNLATEVNAVSGGAAAIAAASRRVGMPTYQLEAARDAAMNSLNQTSGSIISRITNDPTASLPPGMMTKLGANVSTAAEAQAALVLQRRMGLDVESRMTNTRESIGRIGSYLEAKDLSSRVRAGQVGSRADVEASLRTDLNQIERFQGAQGRYAGDPEKFERFQRAIDKLTESANKAASTLKEMDRQGVSGGGGFTGFITNPRVQAGLQLVQGGANLVRDVADQWSYMNPLRERQNQVGYANIANRQFDDQRAALAGDMSALRRLGGVYGSAQSANQMAKTGSRVSTLMEGVGGLAGAGIGLGAGVAAAALAGTGVGIPVALGVMGVAGLINRGVSNWNQQAGERGQALAEAEIRRQDALNKINDQSAQSYRDYSANIAGATVGMGGLRYAGFTQLNSQQMLNRYASVGITGDQAAQLAGAGVQALGREFNPNQIERAGQLRQGGYMNEQQYFQAVGQMSSVGGNADKQLEEILKNAVANGMDNAKSIAQMVQATSSLASRTAATGVDTLSGAGAVTRRMMDAMEDAGVPMNMRGTVAQAAGAFVQGVTTDTSTNLYTVGRWSNTARNFRGASRAQMEYMAQMSAEDVAQLQGANGADYARKRGIDNLVLDQKGQVDPTKVSLLQRSQREQVINNVLGPGLSEEARRGMLRATSYDDFQGMISRGEISEQAGRDVRSRAATRGISAEAVFAAVERTGSREGNIRTETEGGAGEMDRQRRMSAEADAKIIDQGREIIDALGGLKGLTDALGQVAKNFDPKEMAKSTKEAAGSFSVPVKAFGDAVTTFRTAVESMGNTKR